MGASITELLLVLFVVSSYAVTIPPPRWQSHPYKVALETNVFLYWTPNGNEVTFEIQAPTKGWIGFGLGTGHGMTGADIVVGWVKNGKATLQDMHAERNAKPVLDEKQDWKLLNAEETGTITALRFSRVLDTGDCTDDLPITADTMHILWAYHPSDEFEYHQFKGQMSLHLLDSAQPQQVTEMPPDVKTFDLIMPNVTVPANKSTLYWCQVLAIPKLTSKHHIIKYAAIIDKPQIAHHMIAYGCFQPIANASLYNTGFECYTQSMPPELFNCRETTLGWAVGGDELVHLPPEAGISIGTREDVKFFMLEMHYNNADKKDWIDQSGFKAWYTPTLRKYDAGTLTTGASVQIIPPKSIFTTHGICSEECTRKFVTEPEGLRIFAYSLHSHLLGRKIRARHIRKGVQIGWFGKDENYNFNYQQVRMFNSEKRLLPGDAVIVECVYDSSERELNTYHGLSTMDEMCLVFLFYYPRIKMSGCTSMVPAQNQVNIFNASVVVADNGTVLNPANYRGEHYKSIFDHALWNDRLVQSLQQVQSTQSHIALCGYANSSTTVTDFIPIDYPSFKAMSIQEGTCALPSGSQSATKVGGMASSSWRLTSGLSMLPFWLTIAVLLRI